jgi:RNA polymerase sigma-70 factor (ECF subfamily)
MSAEPDLDGLMDAIARGCEKSLEHLYERTVEKVYSLAYAILQNAFDAEEVAADVYCRAWTKAGTYSPDRGKVTTWLLVQCRSMSIDLLRRKAMQAEKLRRLSDEPVPAVENTGPPEILARAQRKSSLDSGFRHLSEAQRQVVHLFFYGGYSQTEIADILQSPLSTVKSHMRRSLAALRKVVQH